MLGNHTGVLHLHMQLRFCEQSTCRTSQVLHLAKTVRFHCPLSFSNGCKVTAESDPTHMLFTDSLLYSTSTERFYFHTDSISPSVFDGSSSPNFSPTALLLQDIATRIQYSLPGYRSSGMHPCIYDTLSEEELRKRGLRPGHIGIPGMVRCYLHRIRMSFSHVRNRGRFGEG